MSSGQLIVTRASSLCAWVFLIASVVSSSSRAQEFGDFGNFSFPGADTGEPVEFSASFEIKEGKRDGQLKVTAKLSDPWYIYSVTQPPGGPLKTEIELKGKEGKLAGPFQSDKSPKVVTSEVFKGIPIEEHFGSVTWTAPLELAEGVDPKSLKLLVVINGQSCIENGSCKPISDVEVEATFAGFIEPPPAPKDGPYRDPEGHVDWSVEIKPAVLPPGGKGEIVITGTPEGKYHLYPVTVEDDETKFKTLIVVDQKSDLAVAKPKASSETVQEELVPGQPPISYHQGEVKWSIPFEVPGTAAEGVRSIRGMVGFQACDEKSCDQPLGFSFSGELKVDSNSGGGKSGKLALAKVPFEEVAGHPQRLEWFKAITKVASTTSSGIQSGSLETVEPTSLSVINWLSYVGMALMGGFILNFMPCVLPVIGLKIMGFATKGKQDVHRIEVLDFWFIFGIMSVLWGLAAITIGANMVSAQFNWGEQFTLTEFKVTITVIVFAMALSFLGVWEIPIPGFAQSNAAELMEQEGPVGAFFKGFFTTVLATPCSGPFLGVVFGACIGQPWWIVLSLFTAIGLGLSSPYIVLAINPRLLFWLPKPGAWMNTLKEIMAFPLLFTVVFLVSTVNRDYRIATLALLMVVWFACWLIGKVPAWGSLSSKVKSWGTSIGLIAVSSYLFFNYLGPIDKKIPWQPFSEAKLAQLRAEGKTIMIDFTADWCLTCKLNLASAIETEKVSTLIKQNKVVPLLADWTDPNDEIKKKLAELRSASIPLLAIYPPNSEPIVLRDSLLESTVIKALEQAGPSSNGKTASNAKQPGSITESGELTPTKL